MREEMLSELTEDILPFWMDRMKDERNGGFAARITGKGVKDECAEKAPY